MLAMAASLYAAAMEKGAADIELHGGNYGNIQFPHQMHQQRLGDCQICHAVFPMEAGAIDKLKADGTLKAKQVMNKHCIKCHRAEMKAGNPHGPLTCRSCHVR